MKLDACYADLSVVRCNESTKWARGNHDIDRKLVHITNDRGTITVTKIKK